MKGTICPRCGIHWSQKIDLAEHFAGWCQGVPQTLTLEHLTYVQRLVRMDIRKTERARAAARAKYGDACDTSRSDRKIAFAEEVYRALGRDPRSISGREEEAHGGER